MKKRVLIDLERLRYPNSGIAAVFRNLAKGLKEYTTDLEIEIFGPVEEISKSKFGFRVIPRKIWHKFLDGFSVKYHIIHVSHQFSSYFQSNYKSVLKVVTLHDLNFLHENLDENRKQKYINKVNNNLRYADYVVCISNFVKDDFIKHKHLFDLKKLKDVSTIYNGLKFPEKKGYSINPDSRISVLQNKKYLLNIGVLFPKKNQLSLIKMLSHLDEDLVLVVSGAKHDYESKINREIKRLKLDGRVHIFRNVSEEEKNILIENCEALCQPSLAEGFGIPPIEAMYFGKPVFLSKLTSLPEVGGEHAFYFNNFEAHHMAEVLKQGLYQYETQPDLQQQMIDWALQFDYKVTAKKYLDLYQKLLN
ncbi:glycosyl transferase family 1 [Elizabethkingia meningoseptica]|uniref:glycosyltransferase family 4 protein n=1 Tax=Elizabethkingia meningoseptica TaxID=238 RepID=UPI000332C972|nr:glycosyltransferase family 1 protein [Elizabethkingia meningoseptica]AQX04102.1 glycosyl transferase family 1 [Elizabethkingia meningoseptica]AQX46143.1 glycosyl transferase family 1 [Elizabethkingia meningoseptica]EOR30518.1 glycosyl transferase, group 1 [Elizabethkingia meningoseptica ATCC 13253 = NBRC 12535]KUY15435.1 glycosyl transferase family 1 [Elizabethkingia meningoseptica]OPB69193.1 glycosyl transferase family 1 [Elizabethkingia meningoseptica]